MEFDLRFTDNEITAWGGMGLKKRMLDHLGFESALAASGLPQPGRAVGRVSGFTEVSGGGQASILFG